MGLLFFILFSRTVVRRRLVVTSALCQCKQSLSLRPSSNKAPHALILYPSLSKYWIKTSLFSLILNASYNILYGESEKKSLLKWRYNINKDIFVWSLNYGNWRNEFSFVVCKTLVYFRRRLTQFWKKRKMKYHYSFKCSRTIKRDLVRKGLPVNRWL